MRVGVVLGGFAGMVRGVKSVTMRDVGVVRGFLMVAVLVVLGSLAVVSRCVLVMFGGLSVVFGSFVVLHRNILFLGENWTPLRQSSSIVDGALLQFDDSREIQYRLPKLCQTVRF